MKNNIVLMIILVIIVSITIYYVVRKKYVWVSTNYSSIPIRVSLAKPFASKDYPNIKFKLLKIDIDNNICLLENIDNNDVDHVNPQWFSKNEAVFPLIYGEQGIIIEEITDNEIYVTVHWSSSK